MISGCLFKNDEQYFVRGPGELILILKLGTIDINQEEHQESEEISQIWSDVALVNFRECSCESGEVGMHVDGLEALIQIRKHNCIHDLDVSANDLLLKTVLFDLDQFLSGLVGHFLEYVEVENLLIDSDVCDEI